MKTRFLTSILTIIFLQSNAQSVSINTDNIRFSNDFQIFKRPFLGDIEFKSLVNSATPRVFFNTVNDTYYGYLGRPTVNALNTFELGAYNSFAIRTLQSDWKARIYVKNSGEVGINTETPTSELEVNGFTKLGSDAPAIKLKKITNGCTTSVNSGFPSGEISLTHGISPSKILKVEALVEYASNFWVKDGNDLFGYEFDVYVTNTTISLRNFSGSASSEIRSKPCKILITYEE